MSSTGRFEDGFEDDDEEEEEELSFDMYNAVEKNDISKLEEILRTGVSPDGFSDLHCRTCGKSILHVAVEKGRLDCANMLIDFGAEICMKDEWGISVFMYSVIDQYPEVAKMLLQRNPEAVDMQNKSGKAALHCAVEAGNLELVKLILDSGGDVNIHDYFGITPLMRLGDLTDIDCHVEIAEVLIDRGASINLRDFRNKMSALQYAVTRKQVGLVQTLLAAGADLSVVAVFCLNLLSVSGQPAGCIQVGFALTCTFTSWTQPFSASDFSTTPCSFTFNSASGTLAANAFGDLNLAGCSSGTIEFQCSGSSLTIESGSFNVDLSTITTLTFDSCNFNSGAIADSSFTTLTGVTTFSATSSSAGTKMVVTDNTLTGMTAIQTLTVTFMEVATLPANFLSPATSLTTISIKGCSMSTIQSGAFSGLTAVTTLDIANNQLTTLPYYIFDPLQSLGNLGLAGNQWDCTCNLDWVENWVSLTGVTLDASPITCSTPASLSGIRLSKAMFSLSCYTSTTTAATSSDDNDWTSGSSILTYSIATLLIAALVGLSFLLVTHYKARQGQTSSTSPKSSTITKVEQLNPNSKSPSKTSVRPISFTPRNSAKLGTSSTKESADKAQVNLGFFD